MKMPGIKYPAMTIGAAKAPRLPCRTCEKVRAHLPQAIRARLEAVERRMKNGQR